MLHQYTRGFFFVENILDDQFEIADNIKKIQRHRNRKIEIHRAGHPQILSEWFIIMIKLNTPASITLLLSS